MYIYIYIYLCMYTYTYIYIYIYIKRLRLPVGHLEVRIAFGLRAARYIYLSLSLYCARYAVRNTLAQDKGGPSKGGILNHRLFSYTDLYL